MLTKYSIKLLTAVFEEYTRRKSSGMAESDARTFADPDSTASVLGLDGSEGFYEALMELGNTGHIKRFIDGAFILENQGIAFIENGCREGGHTVQNISFNIKNANAPIAGTMNAQTISSNVTVSSDGVCLDELERLIQSVKTPDAVALMEMLKLLKQTNELDAPVPKNLLAKFSDVLKKHTDLIAPLGSALIGIFSGG